MSLSIIEVGELLLELGADIRDGRLRDAVIVSRKLMNLAIDAIPVDELKGSLTERDRKWADLAVDIAESIKVNAMADQAETAKCPVAEELSPISGTEDDEENVPE